MKFDTAFEEMELVLNELNEQFETIKNNEGRIPQIEMDILMETMRRLYMRMSKLNMQMNFSPVDHPLKTVQQETIAQEIDIVQEAEALISPDDDIELKDKTPNDQIDDEGVTNDFQKEVEEYQEEIITDELEEIEEEQIVQKMPKKEVARPSLLLQFEDEIFSVNESIAQKEKDKSLVNKLSGARIENLKSAIGINDKFYFINELFSGNSQAYEDVIYTLNNFKRLEEAMQYVSTLKHRYDWKTEKDAFQKLVRFLERKFMEVHA